MSPTLFRAQVFHTPSDPFRSEGGLESFADGAVAVTDGSVVAVGRFDEIRRQYPRATVHDHRGALLLPGFVDTHVHFPQLPIVGAMGLRLLEWLERRTLPEEARFGEPAYAQAQARSFLRSLLRNGTTSALVFGAHFATAMELFFQQAERSGLRIASGLVVSDRELRPELHVDPDTAYQQGRALAANWHGRARLRYAVTPRFSLSCSEALLEACGALAGELDGALVTSHLNETEAEKSTVAALFPWAGSYLETYERYGLLSESSVYAHNVHPTDTELSALARAGAAVCHCPSSNMFLGSGLFPLRRHLAHGVRLALGSDVGAGTGPGLLKEGLAAYQVQMLHPDGLPLTAGHLLYLATAAGAQALGLDDVGSFAPGMSFDALVLRAPAEGTLAEVWRNSPSPEATLSAAFTLAGEESVAEVYVAGERLL